MRHAGRRGVVVVAIVALTVLGAGIGALATGTVHQGPAAAAGRASEAIAATGAASGPTEPGAPEASALAHSTPVPQVAPLRRRITPDILVTANRSLTSAQVREIIRLGQASAVNEVDSAHVHLGPGSTEAIGVDPSTFRSFAPAGTAESTPLWLSVARGDVAVAHAVADALRVPLGGVTSVGTVAPQPARVGAYATMGLPGVGLVVDHANAADYGLVPDSGLLLATPGQDPVVAAALLAKALGPGFDVTAVHVPERAGHLEWVAPAFGPISSPFGHRTNPLQPGKVEFHPGIDIAAPLGTPIYAASDGVVQYAGPASGYGNEIILQHADGVTTVYGHMSTILVTSGPVTAGQPIALVGSEGESTGPHLHFEVHVNDQLVDPLAWLTAHGVRVQH